MTCMSAVVFLNLNVAELLTEFCCLVPAGGRVGYVLLYTFTFTLHFGWQHSNSEFMFWYRFLDFNFVTVLYTPYRFHMESRSRERANNG